MGRTKTLARLSLGLVAAIAILAGALPLRAQEPPTSAPAHPRTGTPIEAAPNSTLAKIRSSRVIRWGCDSAGGAPFTFFDPSNPDRAIGFEVEIMQSIADKMGVRLERVQADWLALFDMLKADRCDILLNGFEVNDERKEQADFSIPYYRYGQQLTIRASDSDKYTTLDDLKGKPVSVLNGSAAVDALTEAGWTQEYIKQYDDSLAPYTEVVLGRVEASLAESIIAAYYTGNNARLHNLPTLFAFGEYAAVVRKADTELLQEINAILAEMKASGELGEIYQRWGIWNDEQPKIGIARGQPQQVLGAARSREVSRSASDWGAIAAVLWRGVQFTILLTIVSMPVAVVFGLVLALGSMSPRSWIRAPATFYIVVVRGTPLLVQVFLVYYSLPPLGKWLYGLAPSAFGVVGLTENILTWPNLLVGIICLAGNYAAYEAEIHRAGLQAVPKGQREAAASLGLTKWQAFRHVVLPQSMRIVLPPIVNDLNSMIKDSCLVSVIGVPELLQSALGIGKARFIVPKMLVIAALVYLVLCVAADWLGRTLERRLQNRAARGAMKVQL